MILTPLSYNFFTYSFSFNEENLISFVYIRKGFAEILSDSTRYKLNHGEGLIIPGAFTLNAGRKVCGVFITFSHNALLPCAVSVKAAPKSKLQRALAVLPETDALESVALYLSGLCEHFLLQTEKLITRGNPHYAILAKNYIDENFTESITLLSVARFCGISKTHLSACFTEEYGISPWQHLTCKRIEKACHMLNETTLNSKEIAKATGYSSPQRFNSMFKKITGVTPLQWRAGIKPLSLVKDIK